MKNFILKIIFVLCLFIFTGVNAFNEEVLDSSRDYLNSNGGMKYVKQIDALATSLAGEVDQIQDILEIISPKKSKFENKSDRTGMLVYNLIVYIEESLQKEIYLINESSIETKEVLVDVTVSQKNAVKMAESYLEYTAFSRKGLIEQLEYEGFSNEDAVYGTDNSNVDWYEQAVKMAESYLEYTAFSRKGLIEQLEYEGFTQSQAENGVDATGL